MTHTFQVLPINDSEEHTEDSTCKCNPSVEVAQMGIIIRHNSFDGREAVEQANEILGYKYEDEE